MLGGVRWAKALPSALSSVCSLSSFPRGLGAGVVHMVQLIPIIPARHTSLKAVTAQFLPLFSTNLSLTFIIAMEALSPNLLSLILPAVGCIEEVMQLREVCKRWKEALGTVPLLVSFEYSRKVGMQPWFLASNLRYQVVSMSMLRIVFQHCWLRKLDISYTDVHGEYQRFLAYALSTEEVKCHCTSLEELRLSGMNGMDQLTACKTAELFPTLRTLYVNNVPSAFPASAFFTA